MITAIESDNIPDEASAIMSHKQSVVNKLISNVLRAMTAISDFNNEDTSKL